MAVEYSLLTLLLEARASVRQTEGSVKCSLRRIFSCK